MFTFSADLGRQILRPKGKMESTVVNQSYLEQLKSLADEQNESSFIAQLIGHLELEYQNTLRHESAFLQKEKRQDEETLNVLHRLKNSFSNLGAEPASVLIEQLRHAVKDRRISDDEMGILWQEFRTMADRTLRHLDPLR
jgi:hypothetical protein